MNTYNYMRSILVTSYHYQLRMKDQSLHYSGSVITAFGVLEAAFYSNDLSSSAF